VRAVTSPYVTVEYVRGGEGVTPASDIPKGSS